MPPLPADSIHARACKLKCEKILTRPTLSFHISDFLNSLIYTWKRRKTNPLFQLPIFLRSAPPAGAGSRLYWKESTADCSPLPGGLPSPPGPLQDSPGRSRPQRVQPPARRSPGGLPASQGRSRTARADPGHREYSRLLAAPLVATQLPRAAPGRPGGCQPPPGGRWHRRLLSPLLVATSFSGQLCFSSLATLGCLL